VRLVELLVRCVGRETRAAGAARGMLAGGVSTAKGSLLAEWMWAR